SETPPLLRRTSFLGLCPSGVKRFLQLFSRASAPATPFRSASAARGVSMQIPPDGQAVFGTKTHFPFNASIFKDLFY
ncbi:MAG: hypothetical protein AB7E32_11895, partial [Desulfovibrio sp.]